jgi:hypothetical protein
MVGSAEDLGDSEDASPAYRDFLPDVWVPACIMAVLIYFGTLALVQAQWIPSDNADTFRETPPLHDAKYSSAADPYFSWVAELCAVAFLASAARNLGTIAFMRRGSSQTSVLLCVTLINLVAAHAHWLMAYGVGPVYDSCFGRRMHVRAKYRCIMNNAHSLFFLFFFHTPALFLLSQILSASKFLFHQRIPIPCRRFASQNGFPWCSCSR